MRIADTCVSHYLECHIVCNGRRLVDRLRISCAPYQDVSYVPFPTMSETIALLSL